MVYIDSLDDAINYWRSNKGGKTYAGDNVIKQIKRAIFDTILQDIIPGIRLKIK